jgi:hypothetical protein
MPRLTHDCLQKPPRRSCHPNSPPTSTGSKTSEFVMDRSGRYFIRPQWKLLLADTRQTRHESKIAYYCTYPCYSMYNYCTNRSSASSRTRQFEFRTELTFSRHWFFFRQFVLFSRCSPCSACSHFQLSIRLLHIYSSTVKKKSQSDKDIKKYDDGRD